jgi:hypothetical protein
VHELLHAHEAFGEQFIDFVLGVRVSAGTLARQLPCIFRPVSRQYRLKKFRKFGLKIFPVQIVIELFGQEIFQLFKSPRLEEIPF